MNASLSSKSAGAVCASNFFLFSSFAGLYDRPSPFPYRKHVRPFDESSQARTLPHISALLWALRSWVMSQKDAVTLMASLLLSRRMRAIQHLLPAKNAVAPYDTPFFYRFSKKKINGSFLKASEQLTFLERGWDGFRPNSVCEIGAGFGAMVETYVRAFRPTKYVILDLPETLDLSYGYLLAEARGSAEYFRETFPIGEWRKNNIRFDRTEISFLDATDPKSFGLKGIELFVNSNSFAEMDAPTLESYLRLIDQNQGTFVLSANPRRVEGSFEFDPEIALAGRANWELVLRARQRAHSSYKGNIVTVHRVSR